MRFLYSNFPPVRTNCDSFSEAFYDYASRSKKLDIAVGYITSDSLVELQKLAEFNSDKIINLTIGMHYYDLFTKVEYNAATELNRFLMEEGRGEVRLVTPFRFHGKMYLYSDSSHPIAGIIGSNNLSSIVEGGVKSYEASILLDDEASAAEMSDFISRLVVTSTENIGDLSIDNFKTGRSPLEGQEHVVKVSDAERIQCAAQRTALSFNIPVKPYEVSAKSNMNVFFGKGREGKNGLVKPRHWYEIEVIVSKDITSLPGYPKSKEEAGAFDVITDDGWKFKCYVGGDYNKNFRSENDLKILGRWLKGRMEEAGVLQVGQPVTQDTLNRYGRSSFSLTKTEVPNLWYLDFGV